ncbi:hypothetical protein SAMD00024442_24_30 [Candidatus Symbiothrix dinenymphae]|nr:hypothetical protein SAMD00024442_24_30 [Candidatus Symbiothrix dinenymphae]
MKREMMLFIALFACGQVFAQGEIDALRLSRNDLAGTARGQAMGGAFGALGGDVTGVTINPAGLGVYSRSEFSTSISFVNNTDKAVWNSMDDKGSKFDFNFESLSYMAVVPTGSKEMPFINFGFSYNRLKNFVRNYNASASDMSSSLTDYMVVKTNGYAHPANDEKFIYESGGLPWIGGLGYNARLINAKSGTTNMYESPLSDGDKVSPTLSVSEQGAINNFDFSIATNLNDQLYFGLDFSYTDIFYKANTGYTENFYDGGNGNHFGYVGLDNYFETTGSGYQVKLGAIWKPINELRVGVAYHSPTWYVLTDYYQGLADVNYLLPDDSQVTGKDETPRDGLTDYHFKSPYSWTVSLAGVLGSKAIVSLDYEMKDYTCMDLSNQNGSEFYYRDMNSDIDKDFKMASTLRAGVEYRITSQVSGRLGYAWMENPYEQKFKDGENLRGDDSEPVSLVGTVPNYTIEGNTQYFTAGLGYKFTPNTYLDLAFVYQQRQDKLYAFPSVARDDLFVTSTPATLNHAAYKTMLTLGYKF